jgi:hypothetical protein
MKRILIDVKELRFVASVSVAKFKCTKVVQRVSQENDCVYKYLSVEVIIEKVHVADFYFLKKW